MKTKDLLKTKLSSLAGPPLRQPRPLDERLRPARRQPDDHDDRDGRQSGIRLRRPQATVETFTQVPDYTVTFQADGATVKTMTVEDGYTLKDSDYPAVPTKTGYTGEWVKYTTAIHSNVTVQAKYTAVSTDHTVTFKANGKTVKTMVVPDGYVLQDSDYPPIPPRVGYKGSWSKVTTAIRRDTVIYASYMPNGGGIVIPTQPTSPGEIMSGGEGEPVEADVPAEDETVSPQGTHVTGTQTVTHEYLTLNGKVARETIKTNNSLTAVLDFIYDESGKPFALKYSTNGTSFETYYYVLNLQGDVVKLIHYIPGFEYESVATYEYDAWGNVSSSGRLAEINPLRYRGYYYDNETGFYYLQSRYYDPANRRFINADSLASTGQGSLGTNMFAYCNNCPTIYHDPSGHAISPLTNNRTAIREGDYGKSNKRPGPRSNAARDELISYFESLTPAYNIEDYYGAPSNINITVEYDDIYEKRNHATRDRVIGGASLVVGIIGLFCSAPIITILGAGLSAAGEISANSNDADPVPEGDFDGYIVTVTWDIPYIELPSSSNTPRLTGYSAQYYVIYCDSFREPFWAIIDYSLFEVYG